MSMKDKYQLSLTRKKEDKCKFSVANFSGEEYFSCCSLFVHIQLTQAQEHMQVYISYNLIICLNSPLVDSTTLWKF